MTHVSRQPCHHHRTLTTWVPGKASATQGDKQRQTEPAPQEICLVSFHKNIICASSRLLIVRILSAHAGHHKITAWGKPQLSACRCAPWLPPIRRALESPDLGLTHACSQPVLAGIADRGIHTHLQCAAVSHGFNKNGRLPGQHMGHVGDEGAEVGGAVADIVDIPISLIQVHGVRPGGAKSRPPKKANSIGARTWASRMGAAFWKMQPRVNVSTADEAMLVR
eukprot:1160207-Pelagomonas_calceolata.AAC.3